MKITQRRKPLHGVLHLFLLPAVLLVFVFNYVPMFGIVIAFQDFKPALGFAGSPWVGLKHFEYMFRYDNFYRILNNTLIFVGSKIVLNVTLPLVFAILLNEVRNTFFKKSIQTFVYLPHFLSWVTLAGILTDMLSTKGIVNQLLYFLFGMEPVLFMSNGDLFRFVVIASDVWKEFGFGAIIYLAALTGINPSLYEASEVDGASRWKQTLHITIPSLVPIMILVLTLSMGNVLNANFDQIFNLYNPMVYDKGDIIDTFVYRTGLMTGQFSFGTAVGLFKSAVCLFMIVISYRIAHRYANYRIF